MSFPLLVTIIATLLVLVTEILLLVNWLRQRRAIAPSGVPGRSIAGLELVWALGPAVILAILVFLTFSQLGLPGWPAGLIQVTSLSEGH